MEEPERTAVEYLTRIAGRLGYVLNPDDTALSRVVRHMAENKRRYGKYYCPCKQHYPVETGTDPTCPCAAFKEEIARDGHCECHIFFDPDAAKDLVKNPGLLATVACPG